MTTIQTPDFNYDSETRIVSFNVVECWSCKGTGQDKSPIYCKHYAKKTRGVFPGGKCPECGSTTRDGHKIMDWKPISCYHCNGTGKRQANNYDSVDVTPLFGEIQFVFLTGFRPASFNESYLGIGIIAGCTDYGSYLSKCQNDDGSIDHERFIQNVLKPSFMARNSSVQMVNHFLYGERSDKGHQTSGEFIRYAYVKFAPDGWHVSSSRSKELDTAIESYKKGS